jgi:hypothetical protein
MVSPFSRETGLGYETINPDANGFRANTFVNITPFLEGKIEIMKIYCAGRDPAGAALPSECGAVTRGIFAWCARQELAFPRAIRVFAFHALRRRSLPCATEQTAAQSQARSPSWSQRSQRGSHRKSVTTTVIT